jgi:hypothetical protein
MTGGKSEKHAQKVANNLLGTIEVAFGRDLEE